MTVARTFKRCDCHDWDGCPHQWVVRYRTTGGRSSRQREQSFGDDLREAEDFALKVEHDKRARTFVDPKAGRILFRDAAGTWLDQHLGAESSIATYRSVLRAHIDPAIGGKPIGAIRREDIKALIAAMHRRGLSASRVGCAHLVISAVLAEAVRDTPAPVAGQTRGFARSCGEGCAGWRSAATVRGRRRPGRCGSDTFAVPGAPATGAIF
jgi:hypothetical protein